MRQLFCEAHAESPARAGLCFWYCYVFLWLRGRIPNVAAGHLDGPDFQCLFINPEVDLPPDAAFCTAVLACIPLAFAFALDLDPGAVDQQVERALRPPMRDVHGKGLLATAERAEVRHLPVQADQAKQALDEPGRLPQRHAEQDLHRQAGLDGRIAVDRLPPTLACRLRRPRHVWIKPDRQRAPALERLVILGPVQGLVSRCVRSAHAPQLSRWIHKMNPSRDLCNRARNSPYVRAPADIMACSSRAAPSFILPPSLSPFSVFLLDLNPRRWSI